MLCLTLGFLGFNLLPGVFYVFSIPGTGGLSGSPCTLSRAMEGRARQKGREKVPAPYSREEEGRKITSVRTRGQKVGQDRVK